MEDVLEVYQRPYDPLQPTVYMDELSKQLVGEVVEPLPLERGQPARYDYEYVRNGVNNLFMLFEPLAGRVSSRLPSAAPKLGGRAALKARHVQGFRREFIEPGFLHSPTHPAA
jgi:hypothetical protein